MSEEDVFLASKISRNPQDPRLANPVSIGSEE
jgi:hypothetical protein